MLFEKIFGIEGEAEDTAAGVMAGVLECLDLAGDFLEAFFDSAEIGLQTFEELHGGLEAFANLGGLVDENGLSGFEAIDFLLEGLLLGLEKLEALIGIGGGASDDIFEGIEDQTQAAFGSDHGIALVEGGIDEAEGFFGVGRELELGFWRGRIDEAFEPMGIGPEGEVAVGGTGEGVGVGGVEIGLEGGEVGFEVGLSEGELVFLFEDQVKEFEDERGVFSAEEASGG